MTIIRKRIQNPVDIGTANAFDQQRIDSMRQERCWGSCRALWPASMITVRESDGMHLCPNDMEIGKVEIAIMQAENAARAEGETPLPFPPTRMALESPVGAVTSITTAAGLAITPTAPLQFQQGGAAKTVLLTGVRFSATDTLSYSAGFSDSVAPVVTSTLITLSLVVAGGTTAGDRYSLTFNGTTFRNIFSVR